MAVVTALCGGVGGSKLALGLYRTLPPDSLTVIVNTADDLTFCGLHVSPDLDTCMYTLAGLARKDVGWGIEGDTFEALDMLRRYGTPTWFAVGDRDLATDVYRTHALSRGQTLQMVTAEMAARLEVRAGILPMSNDPVATRLLTEDEWIDFQEYFVHRQHAAPVSDVRYEGAETAHPAPGVTDALLNADVIVLVNSNPVLSILPILAVPGIEDALQRSTALTVAVSPLIGESAVTGPAGELMALRGQPSTASGVAALYRDLIQGLVIDDLDTGYTTDVQATGIQVHVAQTMMRTVEDREQLALEVVEFACSLR